MQKRIAFLYDFDYTLSHGFMQEFGLMQDHGYDDIGEYFKRCEDIFQNKDIDMCLSMMGGVLQMAKEKNRKVTKEYLQSFGKHVKYYDGVEEWFDKVNAIGKSYGYEMNITLLVVGSKKLWKEQAYILN